MLSLTSKNVLNTLSFFIGGMFIAISQPAISLPDVQAQYSPTERTRPQRTQGGGSRGCVDTEPVFLQLLVPAENNSRTVSSHPTLSWYISAVPSTPLEFALVEEGVAKPILVKRLPVKNAGLMHFKLPQDISGLEIGKEYRWTVSLICNLERPSQSTYARAWIQRSAVSSSLDKTLANKSAYDKALAYIKAGIWYDAIASITEPQLSGSDLTLASNLFKDLMKQARIKESGAIKLL